MLQITEHDLVNMLRMSTEELKFAIDILEGNKTRLYDDLDNDDDAYTFDRKMREINVMKSVFEFIFLKKMIKIQKNKMEEIREVLTILESSNASHDKLADAYNKYDEIDMEFCKYSDMLDALKNGPYADYLEICDI
jgi:hypothetical protein